MIRSVPQSLIKHTNTEARAEALKQQSKAMNSWWRPDHFLLQRKSPMLSKKPKTFRKTMLWPAPGLPFYL